MRFDYFDTFQAQGEEAAFFLLKFRQLSKIVLLHRQKAFLLMIPKNQAVIVALEIENNFRNSNTNLFMTIFS